MNFRHIRLRSEDDSILEEGKVRVSSLEGKEFLKKNIRKKKNSSPQKR